MTMLSPHFVFTCLVRPPLSFLLSLSLSLSLSVESRGTQKNPGRRVTRVTKFCTVGPHIFGFPVWNWLHITLRLSWILRWFIYIYIYLWTPGWMDTSNNFASAEVWLHIMWYQQLPFTRLSNRSVFVDRAKPKWKFILASAYTAATVHSDFGHSNN